MADLTPLQFWIIIGALPVISLAAGLARFRFRSAPVIATRVIIALYVIYSAGFAAWVVSCPDCHAPGGQEWTKVEMAIWYCLVGGLYGGGCIALVWIGAGLAALPGWIRTLSRPDQAGR